VVLGRGGGAPAEVPGTYVFGQLLRYPVNFGAFECHRLDELRLPNLWIENLERGTAVVKQYFTESLRVVHLRLVFAHAVEQSAHLPADILRLVAYLRTWGERRVHTRANVLS